MKLFWTIWEYFSNLSLPVKKILFFAALGTILGMPMSELGWVWRWARQSVQIQNCGDDTVRSILDSTNGLDPQAHNLAMSHNYAQDLKLCAREAIQHPKGPISFLVDEQKRLSANAPNYANKPSPSR